MISMLTCWQVGLHIMLVAADIGLACRGRRARTPRHHEKDGGQDRETERQRDRGTKRQRDRETHTHTDTHTHMRSALRNRNSYISYHTATHHALDSCTVPRQRTEVRLFAVMAFVFNTVNSAWQARAASR